jgi:ankyrin repeat protein
MKKIVLIMLYSIFAFPLQAISQENKDAQSIGQNSQDKKWDKVIETLKLYYTDPNRDYELLIDSLSKNVKVDNAELKISKSNSFSASLPPTIEFIYSIVHKNTPIALLENFIALDKKHNKEIFNEIDYKPSDDLVSAFWTMQVGKNSYSLLFFALRYGSPEQVALLLQLANYYKLPYPLLTNQILNPAFYILNSLTKTSKADDMTGLHVASQAGNLEVIKYLESAMQLKKNDFENNKAGMGMTPLLLAAQNGHIDVVKYLIDEKKVAIKGKNENGDTVLSLTTKPNTKEFITYLVNKEPGLLNTDSFMHPIINNDIDTIETLSKLAQENNITINYDDALYNAINKEPENESIIKFFIEKSPNADKIVDPKLYAQLMTPTSLEQLARALHALG